MTCVVGATLAVPVGPPSGTPPHLELVDAVKQGSKGRKETAIRKCSLGTYYVDIHNKRASTKLRVAPPNLAPKAPTNDTGSFKSQGENRCQEKVVALWTMKT